MIFKNLSECAVWWSDRFVLRFSFYCWNVWRRAWTSCLRVSKLPSQSLRVRTQLISEIRTLLSLTQKVQISMPMPWGTSAAKTIQKHIRQWWCDSSHVTSCHSWRTNRIVPQKFYCTGNFDRHWRSESFAQQYGRREYRAVADKFAYFEMEKRAPMFPLLRESYKYGTETWELATKLLLRHHRQETRLNSE